MAKFTETGKTYGRWTVIEHAGIGTHGALWRCICKCGTKRAVRAISLRNGSSKSCGCYRIDRIKERGYPSRRINETGNVHGRLTVIESAGKDKRGVYLWRCRCECGNETTVSGIKLRFGWTKSCGCFRRDKAVLPEGEAAFNLLVYRYKRDAKRRGRAWELTKDQIREIIQRPCHYCGTEPSLEAGTDRTNGRFICNGMDRYDNDGGYTLDNVVACCEDCNRAKLQRSAQEFLNWVERVYLHCIF